MFTLDREPCDRCLLLCVSAQVVLLTNLGSKGGLVNGSKGVVVDFAPETRYPIVNFANGHQRIINPHTWNIEDDKGYIIASYTQIPLGIGVGADYSLQSRHDAGQRGSVFGRRICGRPSLRGLVACTQSEWPKVAHLQRKCHHHYQNYTLVSQAENIRM